MANPYKLHMILQTGESRQSWQQAQKKAAEQRGGDEVIVKVTGHPWVKAMRGTPCWNWDLCQCNEMLCFLFIGGMNIVGTMQPCPDVYTKPLAGCAWTTHPDGHLMKGPYEPVHPHDGKTLGIGPIRAFARRVIQRRAGDGVILVPSGCGWGDMSQNAWKKDGVLYKTAVDRAKHVAQAVSGRVAGVIWHGGEMDATKEEDANMFEQRLAELVDNLREDFEDPKLPFITGEIGERFLVPEVFKYAGRVNDALRHVGRMRQCACVSAPNGHNKNMLHFHAEAQEEFGTRMADCWDRIWNDNIRTERRIAPDGKLHTRDSWDREYKGLVAASDPKRCWAAAKPYWGDEAPKKLKDQVRPAGSGGDARGGEEDDRRRRRRDDGDGDRRRRRDGSGDRERRRRRDRSRSRSGGGRP